MQYRVRVLLQAPPGYGKSKRLAKIAVELGGRVSFFVRSHMEAFQVYTYVVSYGGTAALMFGRSALCKFGARTSAECMELRERGVCKARYKYLDKKFVKIEDIYEAGVCPYEYLQAVGRQSRVAVLPLSYLESQEYLSSILDVIHDSELVIIDEAHNLLLHDLQVEDEPPSGSICDKETRRCLLMPIVGKLLSDKDVLMASASITKPFSDIFTNFLSLKYVNKDNTFFDNLIIDIYPIKIRYVNRKKKYIYEHIKDIIMNIFHNYNKIIVFFPNKEIYEYYKLKLKDIPISDKPLGDIPHVALTYFGSALAEGLNLDVDAAVLVGFPLPDIKDRWLAAKARLLQQFGFNGFKYVFLFAAVSNAVQAMGRAMRDLDKREKYIAAIDDRFWKYKWAMPMWFNKLAVLRETPRR